MASTKKFDFEYVQFDPDTICWGVGNNAVGLSLMARIELREKNKSEQRKEKKEWEQAKLIYDKHINVGQKFKAVGERANKSIVCKVTYIHNEKGSVTYRQCNMTEDQKNAGYKPASGKFSINALLYMHKSGEIQFID